jgi:hypothetical protein
MYTVRYEYRRDTGTGSFSPAEYDVPTEPAAA